jgi:hypothetical protein
MQFVNGEWAMVSGGRLVGNSEGCLVNEGGIFRKASNIHNSPLPIHNQACFDSIFSVILQPLRGSWFICLSVYWFIHLWV